MTAVTVYLEQGAAAGGDGSSLSPYNTLAAMLSTIVADTALTTLNLVTSGDAIIVKMHGMLTHATRHDLTGVTSSDPRGTNPGDAGTIWFTEDTGQGYNAQGAGAGFTNSSAANETMLCRNNAGFHRINWDGSSTTSTIRGAYRMFTSAQYAEHRQCFSKGNRAFLYLQGAASWQVRIIDCLDAAPASGSVVFVSQGGGANGILEINHCTIGGRLSQSDATVIYNITSSFFLYSFDNPHCTGTMNVERCCFAVSNPASAGDADWYITAGSGNLFAQNAFSNNWLVSTSNFNLTLTGNAFIGTNGVGTNTSPTLATDSNGTARGATSSALGALEYIAAGVTYFLDATLSSVSDLSANIKTILSLSVNVVSESSLAAESNSIQGIISNLHTESSISSVFSAMESLRATLISESFIDDELRSLESIQSSISTISYVDANVKNLEGITISVSVDADSFIEADLKEILSTQINIDSVSAMTTAYSVIYGVNALLSAVSLSEANLSETVSVVVDLTANLNSESGVDINVVEINSIYAQINSSSLTELNAVEIHSISIGINSSSEISASFTLQMGLSVDLQAISDIQTNFIILGEVFDTIVITSFSIGGVLDLEGISIDGVIDADTWINAAIEAEIDVGPQ